MPVPADRALASVGLVPCRSGHCTTMAIGPAELSVRTVEGSLVADAEAVLLKVVQLVERSEERRVGKGRRSGRRERGWKERVRVRGGEAAPTVNARAWAPRLG